MKSIRSLKYPSRFHGHFHFVAVVLSSMVVALATNSVSAMGAADEPIDFNRDIRPLLSDRCYQCHGPDENERQAGLRLDIPEEATSELDSGGIAVVPYDLDASLLVDRITVDDPYLRMPPEESNKSLSEHEIALLKRWIQEGATFSQHWSFVAPSRPPVPQIDNDQPQRNEIDAFIGAKLRELGLNPSEEADKETLIRRVTFDLTGLPPTLEEVDAFLEDDSPDAYEALVDRLLESPRYGEHMARYWLDAARYGDTHGLHLDNIRQMWPYRNWVIDAFNANKPFDEFTIEQLAGDLLENPTTDQLVATGFNRCNVTTSEGGSINEEYRVRYAVDRVETTSTVFMGLTTGCAVCHDHKFDPISQREFYQLYAYFYNFAENEMDGNAMLPPPIVSVPSESAQEQRQRLEESVAEIQGRIDEALAKVDYVEPKTLPDMPLEPTDYVWIDDDVPTGAKPQGDTPWTFVAADKHAVKQGQRASYRKATGLSQHFFTEAHQPLRVGEGDVLFAHVFLDKENPPQEIMLQFHDGSQWEHRAYWGENAIDWGTDDSPSRKRMGDLPQAGEWIRLEVPVEAVGLQPGNLISGWAFTQFGGEVYWDAAGIVTKTLQDGSQFTSRKAWLAFAESIQGNGLPEEVKQAIEVAADQRSADQQHLIERYFLEFVNPTTRELFDPLHEQLTDTRKQLEQLDASIPKTLVMGDKPRDKWQSMYVLKRGQYDQPDQELEVEPGVPNCLPETEDDSPNNRLGLARWLVDPRHPLTARVTVNRFWQHLFGNGIVKTSEDFGSQGEFPTHPKLLDWMAVEFTESGWDVKHMMKLMVMSHTYRQTSRVLPEHRRVDAANRYLARGPRFRLDAESIRDNALSLAGILHGAIGGPSVKPYQPAGLWKAVGYTSSNTAQFRQDHGEALYRRSMYTFWKRTSPPPTMQIFDAPSREVCTVRRERTNTPAAALAVMNDVQFVEAARCFAERVIRDGGATAEERLAFAFRLATARTPSEREQQVLMELLEQMQAKYEADPEAAQQLASSGEFPRDDALNPQEVAAWTIITSTLMNLDETLTKG